MVIFQCLLSPLSWIGTILLFFHLEGKRSQFQFIAWRLFLEVCKLKNHIFSMLLWSWALFESKFSSILAISSSEKFTENDGCQSNIEDAKWVCSCFSLRTIAFAENEFGFFFKICQKYIVMKQWWNLRNFYYLRNGLKLNNMPWNFIGN